MKHIYQTMLAACFLTATGAMQAVADYWSVSISDDPVAAAEIQADTKYVFQSAASAKAGNAAYLFGTGFTTSTSGFGDKGVFTFVKANEKVNDNEVYYIKCQTGEYVATPGSAAFYTKQVERAWKVVVVEVEEKNAEESYDYQEEGKDPVKYKGIDAYIWRAKAEGSELDLQKATYITESEAPGEIIIADAKPLSSAAFSQYRFLLSGGSVSLGTDYNQNAWILRPAVKMDALEGLDVAMKEIVPEGKTFEEHFKKYVVGTNPGEYDSAKHKIFADLWKQAEDVRDKKVTMTDTQISELIEKLQPAYQEFAQAINPLLPGYYIITNWRGENEQGFDDAALYDNGAVNFGSKALLWSLREKDGVDYHATDELSYNTAKFVWEVIPSGEAGKYYFRNLETGRYIGGQPNLYRPVNMTDKPEATYSMGANPAVPGYLKFFSDFLHTASTNYNGLHAQVAGGTTVSWDFNAFASLWRARTITPEQVKMLQGLIAQPKRNAELTALVNQARTAIEGGKIYIPVDKDGKKIESALTGKFDPVDGLVTSDKQISCPMADPEEGKDINVLFNGNLGDFFHTTWHNGESAWDAHHFLQFQLDNPLNGIIVKWGERNVNNAANGAPKVVRLWGAKDESALDKGKVQKVGEDGQPIEGQYDYDAWKKQGWDSLTVGQFNYDTKMLNSEDKETGRKVGFVALNFNEPYKYLRLEVINKANGAASGFVYGSELRVYKSEYDKVSSPYEAVPAEVMSALQEVLKTADTELAAKLATDETIAKVKAAYEKFRENYPDATRITEVADKIKARLDKAEEGDKLGFYEQGAKAALKAASDKALAELKAITDVRAINVAEVNNLVAELNAALATFEGKLRMPTNGIYRIQSESQHKNVGGNLMAVRSSSKETFDQVCFAGRQLSATQVDTYENTVDRNEHLDYLWQVEKVEGGYTFRNVFTGLYLARKNGQNDRAIMQSEKPYTIKVEFINYPGAFRFVVSDGKDKDEYAYVNAQPSSKTIVTWYSAEGNDNSAFSFQPVADSEVKGLFEDGFVHTLRAKEGYQIITLPINAEFEVSEETGNFYSVVGQKADTKDVVLKEVADKKLNAGQAYVFKPGAKNTGTLRLYTTAKTLADLKPVDKPVDAVNGLFGTFEFTKVHEDNGIFNQERTQIVLTEQGDLVAANSGYFGKLPETTENGDLTIPASQIITLINKAVLAPSAATKGTFSLSGVRVDNVKNLPAGIYVINGQKVVVK